MSRRSPTQAHILAPFCTDGYATPSAILFLSPEDTRQMRLGPILREPAHRGGAANAFGARQASMVFANQARGGTTDGCRDGEGRQRTSRRPGDQVADPERVVEYSSFDY